MDEEQDSDEENNILFIEDGVGNNEDGVGDGEDGDEDDNDTVFDEIYNAEQGFLDKEHTDGEYVLGMFRMVRGAPIYAIGITTQSFFNHTYSNIVRYLHMYSIMRLEQFDVQILKLIKRKHYFTRTVCFYTIEVVNKTIWLKLIQRHWKNAFRRFRARQINAIWEMRECGKMFSQRKGGKVGLQGLMSAYKNIYR